MIFAINAKFNEICGTLSSTGAERDMFYVAENFFQKSWEQIKNCRV